MSTPVLFRRYLGPALIVMGLGLLLLWPLRPYIATLVYDNVGSVLLNRALLTPGLAPSERTARAVQAGRAFQSALAWDPLNGYAYYNLSTIYNRWQDAPSAAHAVRRAAALNPHDEAAHFALGQALAARGQESAARQAWSTAEAAPYFVNRGLALAGQGAYEEAVVQYQRALAITPDLSDGYYYLGRALSGLGRQEEALAALESAAALEPTFSPRRYLLQAEVYAAREEWRAALDAFAQASALIPTDPVPHYRMGWVLDQKLGDGEAAMPHYRQAWQLDPDYVPPRLALARLYRERGECDAVAEWLAPFLLPGAESRLTGQAHTLLGNCLLQQPGREEEGVSHLERAMEAAPDRVALRLALGQSYSQVGRFHDAIETYLQVLEMEPENAPARRALEELGWLETETESEIEDGLENEP